MMDMSFSSAIVLLVLVLDPIGNIPIFVSLLRRVGASRRTRVVLRECAIALAVLLVFVFVGDAALKLFGISGPRSRLRVARSCSSSPYG